MFALNAPNGTIQRVIFSNNIFVDPFIDTIQADSYCIGPQASDVVIEGNTFEGTGQECIHIEEKAKRIVITGNDIYMNVVTQAISITENDAGGATVIPSDIIISSNNIHRIDNAKAADGINLINDGGTEPVHQIIIQGNNIRGWARGIFSAAEDDDGLKVVDNNIYECAVGHETIRGNAGVERNNFLNNDTAISMKGGGMIGFNEFTGNTVNVVTDNCEVTLMGFRMTYPRTTIPATGNVELDILPMSTNERVHGWGTTHAYFNDANEDKHRDELAWDGTTFTVTNKYNVGGGQLTLSFQEVSGTMKLRVANGGSELTDTSVFLQFDGAYVVA